MDQLTFAILDHIIHAIVLIDQIDLIRCWIVQSKGDGRDTAIRKPMLARFLLYQRISPGYLALKFTQKLEQK